MIGKDELSLILVIAALGCSLYASRNSVVVVLLCAALLTVAVALLLRRLRAVGRRDRQR